MSLPTIRIKNAWLLRENASKYIHELRSKKGETLADDTWMERRIEEYQKAWLPYEQKILKGMTDITGLSFRQNIIDVYIAPWFNAFSDPMVIGITRKPDDFIDTLTHELLHRLLDDNKNVAYEIDLRPEWKKLFGKQPFNVMVHIPVHAIHKAIYLDILKEPKRLKRDIELNKKFNAKAYVAAWDYVEKHGYKEIIEQLKESYKQLSKLS